MVSLTRVGSNPIARTTSALPARLLPPLLTAPPYAQYSSAVCDRDEVSVNESRADRDLGSGSPMTLTMAWVRKVGERDELVFASDSRLSGGSDWDCCPKILLLPRGDSLLAFAGNTMDAYPLMLQFRNWLEIHPSARNRSLDINDLKKRMRTVFNDMRLFISDLPVGQTTPDPAKCEMILGGWSWKHLAFKIWRFHYLESRAAFDYEPEGSGVRVGRDHPIVFAGDRPAIDYAREIIIAKLKERNRFHTPYLDMEPFEALRDIIRSGSFLDVGGPPQLVKIYRHGNYQPFAILWPMPHDRKIRVLGRPLFPREAHRLPVIDPDNIRFLPEKASAKKIRRRVDPAEQ